MEIRRVFVLGAELMGNGIAQVAAFSGYRVTMCDVSEERLEAGVQAIRSSLGKLLSKGKMTEEQRDATLANLVLTT